MRPYLIKKISVIFLLLISVSQIGQAQPPELINDPEFRPVAQAAVDSVYNFNFEGADKLLIPWKKEYPNHPLWMLFESMELWWHVLSDLEDTSKDEEFFYRMKQTDYEASKLLRKNSAHADGLIVKTVSNGYIARQYSNRDEWLAGINRARKALSSHEYLLELQPELADLKLAEGLKLYYSAYLPEAYPVVKTVSWFLPEGDKQKGLALMKEASNQAIFAGAEATYFLGNINYNYQKDYDKAARYFEELYQNYPNNNYYARKLVSSLYKMGRIDDALRIINESLERWEQKNLPYQDVLKEELLTWKGRILMRRGESTEAISSFEEAFKIGRNLPRTSYRTFHVAAGYYLGSQLYAKGTYAEAREILQQVVDCKAGEEYQRKAREILKEIG